MVLLALSHLRASLTEAILVPVEGHVVARRLVDADSRDTISWPARGRSFARRRRPAPQWPSVRRRTLLRRPRVPYIMVHFGWWLRGVSLISVRWFALLLVPSVPPKGTLGRPAPGTPVASISAAPDL